MSLAVAPHQPIGTSMVADWVNTKCGPRGKQLWKYEGGLYDPLDGRLVANVEGLEWVTLRSQNETKHRPIYTQVLNQPNASWTTAATLWSQHVFCYTVGDDKTNRTLLQTLRVRPYSPEKQIPLDQATAVYETESTFIEQANGQVVVHSEWPSRVANQTISLWGSAQIVRNTKDGILGFSVFCKRRSPKSPQFLPDLTTPTPDINVANSSTLVVSPRRSQWIQFGMSNMETKHRFGARETYTMSIPELIQRRALPNKAFAWLPSWLQRRSSSSSSSLQPTLRYSRYGEGPPFYAPGRMCMLELQATPIDHLQEASPLIQQLLSSRISGWDAPYGELRLLVPQTEHETQWANVKGTALTVWEKVRSVTNVVSFFRKERGYWSSSSR